MKDLAVFAIGQLRSQWLAARTSALANNVANADTPGFKPRDIVPFEATLRDTRIAVERTNSAHIAPDDVSGGNFDFVPRADSASKHSGNGVSLELEMASLGEARSQHSMVVGVLGAFQRMLLSSSKG
jgi:flagellar basal-body rod protein FlgB